MRGKAAVHDYWRMILQRRPDLEFKVGHVFVGIDSVVLEYRESRIEFM